METSNRPAADAGYSVAKLPVGFNAFATSGDPELLLSVHASVSKLYARYPTLQSIFSLPVLLYVTPEGHTLMNWYSPRTNCGWPVVIQEDCTKDFPGVRRLTDEEFDELQKQGALSAQLKLGRMVPIVDSARLTAAVQEYQCRGCMNGSSPATCASYRGLQTKGCTKHYAGTLFMGAGTLALGLPKGFTRFGPSERRDVPVFESFEALKAYDPKYSVKTCAPVWMHLNEEGHTLIRWYDAVTGEGHSTVVLEDCRSCLAGALEIKSSDFDDMD